MGYWYAKLARILNDYENHRTDTIYENAMIVKTFFFEFLNNYTSLFYVAYVKVYAEGSGACANGQCFSELGTSLCTIFLTRLIVGNISEVLYSGCIGSACSVPGRLLFQPCEKIVG
jgi:hypothetical protein